MQTYIHSQKSIKIILISLTLLIASLINNQTYARSSSNKNPDSYQVELVIFKYNDLKDINSERWPLHELSIPPEAEKIVSTSYSIESEPGQFNVEKKFYKLLDDDQLNYKNIYRNIKNNSRYKVISHIGWIQPRTDILKAKPVYFKAGKIYKSHNISDSIDLDNDSYNLITNEISGVIKISLKKFFHTDLKLLLSLPAKLNDNSYFKDTAPFEIITNDQQLTDDSNNYYLQSFMIDQNTRLKSKELGYVDHPVFGAVIVIS